MPARATRDGAGIGNAACIVKRGEDGIRDGAIFQAHRKEIGEGAGG